MEHIPYKAGDIICWDYRIPHSNAQKNSSITSREVLYIGKGEITYEFVEINWHYRIIGLLPAIPRNKRYAEEQLRRFKLGVLPSDQWHESSEIKILDHNFSALGRKLMAVDPW
jgi:hypothetical protein